MLCRENAQQKLKKKTTKCSSAGVPLLLGVTFLFSSVVMFASSQRAGSISRWAAFD